MDAAHAEFQSEVAGMRFELKRYAMTIVHDADKADDLAQDTIVKALTKREQFVPGTNLRAWLFTILKFDAYSKFRKKKEVEDVDGLGESLMESNDADQAQDNDELGAVQTLLDSLPVRMSEAIRLVTMEGLTYEEAAKKAQVDVGTVKSRVNRARHLLREVAPERAVRKHRGIQRVDAPLEELRKLSKAGLHKVTFKTEPGTEPQLMWLPLMDLRVDERYQRRVLEKGLTNVYRIAAEFDWKKFTPVVVARVVDGLYAIVDGQHRSYAALLRGIESVPCMVIEATLAEQAEAFAAINQRVTKVNDQQIHAAAIAAGDVNAIAIRDACAAAGVEVCRNPIAENMMKIGQTIAIGTLRQYHKRFGSRCLTLALRCLMVAHPMERGVVRAPLIAATTAVLGRLDELTPETVLKAAKKINFVRELIDARIRASTSGRTVRVELEEVLIRKFQEC